MIVSLFGFFVSEIDPESVISVDSCAPDDEMTSCMPDPDMVVFSGVPVPVCVEGDWGVLVHEASIPSVRKRGMRTNFFISKNKE